MPILWGGGGGGPERVLFSWWGGWERAKSRIHNKKRKLRKLIAWQLFSSYSQFLRLIVVYVVEQKFTPNARLQLVLTWNFKFAKFFFIYYSMSDWMLTLGHHRVHRRAAGGADVCVYKSVRPSIRKGILWSCSEPSEGRPEAQLHKQQKKSERKEQGRRRMILSFGRGRHEIDPSCPHVVVFHHQMPPLLPAHTIRIFFLLFFSRGGSNLTATHHISSSTWSL